MWLALISVCLFRALKKVYSYTKSNAVPTAIMIPSQTENRQQVAGIVALPVYVQKENNVLCHWTPTSVMFLQNECPSFSVVYKCYSQ